MGAGNGLQMLAAVLVVCVGSSVAARRSALSEASVVTDATVYPFATSIQRDLEPVNIHNCSGVLIGSNLVLTKKGCLTEATKGGFVLGVSAYDFGAFEGSGELTTAAIEEVFEHPTEDVILVATTANVSTAVTSPVRVNLDLALEDVATNLDIAGWSSNELDPTIFDFGKLRTASFAIVAESACTAAFGAPGGASSPICASIGTPEAGTCTGQDGAPVFAVGFGGVDVLVGIATETFDCGSTGLLARIVTTSSIISFIQDTVDATFTADFVLNTVAPTDSPTLSPTTSPTNSPVVSGAPTLAPTLAPSAAVDVDEGSSSLPVIAGASGGGLFLVALLSVLLVRRRRSRAATTTIGSPSSVTKAARPPNAAPPTSTPVHDDADRGSARFLPLDITRVV